jgi:hypothetical protein
MLMLLHRLATSTSSGVVGSVTQSPALTGSTTTSQSSTLGPSFAPSLGNYPWYLDSDASCHMTPHSTNLSSLRHYYHHCIVHTLMDPLFLLLDRTLFPLTLFMSLMFLLFLI